MKELQEFVNGYGLGISKKELVSRAYNRLRANGHSCYIINDLYIACGGKEYQLIKSNKEHRWIVKGI